MEGQFIGLSPEYAGRLDTTIRQIWGDVAKPNPPQRSDSLFYYLRPAKLLSQWKREETEEENTPYQASACFIDRFYEVNDNAEILVYSPTSLSGLPPLGTDALVWVVWRGRWEVVNQPAAYTVGRTRGVCRQNSKRSATVTVRLSSGDDVAAYPVFLKPEEGILPGTLVGVSWDFVNARWVVVNREC